MSVVYNISTYDKSKKHDLPAISIMRGTPYGNPFIMGKDGTRDEIVEMFELYARWRMKIQPRWLDRIVDRDVLCCCAPEKCHGDVLVKLAKERKQELIRKRSIKNELSSK